MSKRVIIGLSGGVDSSVAAYLLKEEGYEVIGLFMKNWHDDSVTISDECPWLDDSNDALLVAQKLGIPFQTVDLSKPYKERIVDYMFREYQNGRTPNPDVLCNREIKFDIFLETALNLGADYIATGHYCRKDQIEKDGQKIFRLLAGKDKNKDQSYFLCQLNQYQLSKALFPIGGLLKPEVRKIAKDQDLVTADKKDSQGLCFVGKVRLPEFLMQRLKPRKGVIIEIPNDSAIYDKNQPQSNTEQEIRDSLNSLTEAYQYHPDYGKIVGEHKGAHYFTIGQRKGLGVGGTPEPLFIIDTDTKNNIIYTGQGDQHKGLYRKGLFVKNTDIHWIREDLKLKSNTDMAVKARIRYRQDLEKARIHQREDGLYVIFDKPQRGVTPGQFVAWYLKDELLGSGIIY
ncbi:MAG: tRNA 2-thiouridine(34) synthase MnmA [Cyclobacteriaceae bacterium]|jgi:tRNA-specific 2-thiouridylase